MGLRFPSALNVFLDDGIIIRERIEYSLARPLRRDCASYGSETRRWKNFVRAWEATTYD